MEVITVNGEKIDKKLTRKIKNSNDVYCYYKIGNINQKNSGDCYQINNIFYTIEKGRIVWDEYLNQYVLKTSTVEGITGLDFKRGYFSKDTPNIAIVYLSKEPISDICISTNLAEKLGLIRGENNLFYNPSYYTYEQILPRRLVDSNYKRSLHYNFKDYLNECTSKYMSYQFLRDITIEKLYVDFQNLLDTYTFGVEIETTRGMIPPEVYENLGFRPVRDGSIDGLEYVTIPLTGKKGLYTFVEFIKLINRYNSSNYTCSMHIHVGNVPRTERFIIAMFKTMFYIQDDIYKVFPLYKQYHTGIKRKCYTEPLDKFLMTSLKYDYKSNEEISQDFQKIIYALTNNYPGYAKYMPIESIINHPNDPSDTSKWNIKERYKNLNLIPLIFTNKKTIEYRIFTVPNTIEKALFFLFSSLAITNFAVNNEQTILHSPKAIYNLNLLKTFKYANLTGNARYFLEEHYMYRMQKVLDQVQNKGSFFEESDIKVSEHYGKLNI